VSSNENMTPPVPARREQRVGRDISILARLARGYVDARLAPLGIGFSQAQTLVVLYDGDGISQHEIGKRLDIDKGTLARTIVRLVEEGYVERLPDSRDERAYRVMLTDKAREQEAPIRAILQDWTDGATADLTDAEYAALAGMLARMLGRAEQMGREVRSEAYGS
jgi:DNA-binding MarR family transcriptional regulator